MIKMCHLNVDLFNLQFHFQSHLFEVPVHHYENQQGRIGAVGWSVSPAGGRLGVGILAATYLSRKNR